MSSDAQNSNEMMSPGYGAGARSNDSPCAETTREPQESRASHAQRVSL